MLKIITELRFLQRVNVIYTDRDNEIVFTERVFGFDVPKYKDFITKNGKRYSVRSIYIHKDENHIEVKLNTLEL